MKRFTSRMAVMVAIVVAAGAAGVHGLKAQTAPSVKRTILLKQDMTIPGREAVLALVEIPPGGREGRHTHPGTVIVHVEDGELTLDYDGKPTKTYKAGESFAVEAGKVHEGINKGSAPIRAIAAFVVEKGKPITTQVK